MIAEACPPAASGSQQPDIRVLTADDVGALRLGGNRRLNAATVRALVEDYPRRSVWVRETLEYALLAPWRHRPEIALVEELAAVRHAQPLLAAAVERSRAAGDALTLVIEMDDVRRPSFYARAGLTPIEEVLTYELPWIESAPATRSALSFRRASPAIAADLADLIRIDHAAFPWLWWNSVDEFLAYGQTPGVRLFLGLLTGRPVAYVGITSYPGWGHLDRIAITPALQGRGLGRQALAFALSALAGAGARRVGLSTQRENVRSQRLYERFGFRRSPEFDYRLYGAVLRPPAPGLVAAAIEQKPTGGRRQATGGGRQDHDDFLTPEGP